MRVGLVIYGSLETLTGGYLYDRYLVDHLRARGHRVDIVSLPHRPAPYGFLQNFSPRLLKALSGAGFDLILEDALCHPSLFLANRCLKRKFRIPVVALVHQVAAARPLAPVENWFRRVMEGRFFSGADGFVFNSGHTAEAVACLTGNKRPAITATPGGDRLGRIASAEAISARAAGEGPLRLVTVANLLPNKGIDKLIAALAGVPRERWHLTVAGSLDMDRGHAGNVRALIDRNDLSGRVRLAGALKRRQLAPLLADSHVFLLPFSHESFGIAYLEAMAFGLPAIGSTRGGTRGIIRHGQNGFLLSPQDSQGLARHVMSLDRDRARLGRMGHSARETFQRHPSWEQSMQRACRFLESMAGCRSAPNTLPGYNFALAEGGPDSSIKRCLARWDWIGINNMY